MIKKFFSLLGAGIAAGTLIFGLWAMFDPASDGPAYKTVKEANMDLPEATEAPALRPAPKPRKKPVRRPVAKKQAKQAPTNWWVRMKDRAAKAKMRREAPAPVYKRNYNK